MLWNPCNAYLLGILIVNKNAIPIYTKSGALALIHIHIQDIVRSYKLNRNGTKFIRMRGSEVINLAIIFVISTPKNQHL